MPGLRSAAPSPGERREGYQRAPSRTAGGGPTCREGHADACVVAALRLVWRLSRWLYAALIWRAVITVPWTLFPDACIAMVIRRRSRRRDFATLASLARWCIAMVIRRADPASEIAARGPSSPAGASRAAASGAARLLVDVAMGDHHVEVVVFAVALGQVLGNRHRAVAATGASDRDHEVRLALSDVLRQQEVQQRVQSEVELLQPPIAPDVLGHLLIVARQLAQLGLVVRVGQEAHVKREILLARRAVLEAEAHERERQATCRLARKELIRDLAAEHRRRHARGVDDHVRAAAQRRKHRTLGRNPRRHAAL